MNMEWKGVMPAMTTAFTPSLEIDYDFVARHAKWMVDHGCRGIVTPGSLGEGNTMTFDERGKLWRTIVRAVDDRAPVVAAISSFQSGLSLDAAVSSRTPV